MSFLSSRDLKVTIRAPVYPTETPERVKECLSEVFPEAEWKTHDEEVIGITNSLEYLKETLEDLRIRDAARGQMTKGMEENRCVFTLYKQSTCTGRPSFFVGDQPLGAVEVTIEHPLIEKVIEELTYTGE